MAIGYRLLAIDADGTLVNSRQEVSQGNRLAICRARQAGYRVCLCTGRIVTETLAVLDALAGQLDAGVFVSGALVSEPDTRRTLHRVTLSRAITHDVCQMLAEDGFPVLIIQDRDQWPIDAYYVPGPRNSEYFERWVATGPCATVRVPAWPDDAPEPLRLMGIGPEGDIQALQDRLLARFGCERLTVQNLFAPNYGLHVMEIFAAGVSKWSGIRLVMNDLGIGREQVIAIGDDVNDLEMVAHAGLGVAMANAAPCIKQAATVHTAGHDDDGVAHFIDRLLAGSVGG